MGARIYGFSPCFMHKTTWSKVLNYIAASDEAPQYLLIDGEVVRGKVSIIGKNIKNAKVFYAVKANPDIEVLRFLNSLGIGFKIVSEGELWYPISRLSSLRRCMRS